MICINRPMFFKAEMEFNVLHDKVGIKVSLDFADFFVFNEFSFRGFALFSEFCELINA